MKFISLVIFSLIIFASLSSVYSKEQLDRKNRRNLKIQRNKNATGNTTANNTGPIIINSVGRKVFVSNQTDIVKNGSGPFEVTRCDQVISFPAKYIPDMEDYRTRKDGFVTLTAHYTNLFNDKAGTQLLKSILMSQVKATPSHIRGSKNCIIIRNSEVGVEGNDITICMPDQTKEENVLAILRAFQDCRGGRDMGEDEDNKLAIAAMIAKCAGGDGKFINPKKLLKKLQMEKQNKEILNRNTGFFHPGNDNVVPGSPPPQPIKGQELGAKN